DGGITGSYAAAAFGNRLKSELPSTVALEGEFEVPPSDILVNKALQLARLWRRLAELRTWRPLADAEAVRETLQSLGYGRAEEEMIGDWLAGVYGRQRGPDLIRVGRATADWQCQPGVKDSDPEGIFLGACLWREKTGHAPVPLPFWSAPELYHHRLNLRIGV